MTRAPLRVATLAAALAAAAPPAAALLREDRPRRAPFPEEVAEDRAVVSGGSLAEEVAAYLGRADGGAAPLPWREFLPAEPALRVFGDWQAGLSLSTVLLVDDNVDLDDRDPDGQVVSRTLLAGSLRREGVSVATEANGALEVAGYSEDGGRNAVGGHVGAAVVWDLHPAFVRLRDLWASRTDSVHRGSLGGAIVGVSREPVRRRSNAASVVAGTRTEPTGFEIGFTHETLDHGRAARSLDATIRTVDARVMHRFSPKLTGGVEAARAAVEYGGGRDARARHASAAVLADFRPTEKTAVAARFGGTATRDADAAGSSRRSTATGSLRATWRATGRTTLSASAGREVTASDTATSQVADVAEVGGRWAYSERLTVGFSGTFQRTDPRSAGRHRTWITTLHVAWRLRDGLTVGLVYDRVARAASDAGEGFRAQRYGLQASLEF